MVLAGVALAEISSAVPTREIPVAGLEGAAEIIVDHWGIAHIYAASDRDALFLQGFNAARDRLWQIDLWRKRGLGLLSENFGESYVDQDRATRMFLYRGDMDAEWAAYGPNGRTYAEAFVAGVNAYVQQVLDGTVPLPVEFVVTDTQPDLWELEDVVRIRSHGLTRNASSEVSRAQVACKAGLEADILRRKLEPEWTAEVPDGLNPCIVPEDVLADYELAVKSVRFEPTKEEIAPVDAPEQGEEEEASLHREFLRGRDRDVERIGSNNWTIAPDRTETGRPILANDPHRAHGVPSLRYIVHLNSPNMSVIGAGEPALPGISIGHNGTIAYGLTIFAVDQEDLYFYELNPENPLQYRHGDGWEDIEVVTETIAVRDGEPQEVEMKFTRHGPVLHEADGRAWAMRTVWFEPGTSAYFGSVDYMGAKSWDEFSTAMQRFSAPSENQVYADVEGNIGWIVGAMTPTRTNWDGLLPVPGDGRYEWEFLDPAELPSSYNPEQGSFATANQMNMPEDFPWAEHRIGFEWSDPSRYQRIAEVLSANDSVSLADAMALQNDDTSKLNQRLVALVADLEPSGNEAAAEALALLKGWDGVVSADSPAAVVGELMLTQHLGQMTAARILPGPVAEFIGDDASETSTLDLLEAPDARFGADPEAARDDLLMAALEAAVEQAQGLLGKDVADWQWGNLHKAYFEADVTPLASEALAEQMRVGPLAMGGSATTPRAASYNDAFRVTSGASFRIVLDVGNWDASRAVNTPGQSGDPASPHYRNLAPYWAAGEYVPLVYSRAKVEENASAVIRLTP
ncbi:penicillin acylase family protein [Cereibacter sp. SYSU M97828]|nr:penicillin acylase family protein [Cereibacter flavus]